MTTPQRRSHRLGILLAAILFTIGLVVTATDIVRLRLWDITLSDLPTVLAGVTVGLIGIVLACFAVYGIVRAIGWVIARFVAS